MSPPRVLVTRAAEDAPALAALLSAAGLEPVLFPCVELSLHPEAGRVAERLRAGRIDGLVLSSPNAVRFLALLLEREGLDPAMALAGPALFAVGEATAAALRVLAQRPVEAPAQGAGAQAFLAGPGAALRGKSLLLPRAERGTPGLVDGLRAAGAAVEVAPLYRASVPAAAPAEPLRLLRARAISALSFASGSAARGFAALAGPELAACARVICMGESCARAARRTGLSVDAVADGGLTALRDAILRALPPP